jgi:signal peptidase II
MMDRYRWLGLAIGVALADQWAKHWIAGTFPLGAGETVLPFFNLVHILNSGAAFSFLANAGGWHWPAFNLADTALCLSALILLLGTLPSSAQSKAPT